jgi:hypothetical protein
MMNILQDVIRKMRKFVADRSLNERTTFLGGVVKDWADALETAMREKDAEIEWLTKENRILRKLDTDWQTLVRKLDTLDEKDAEIEKLREALWFIVREVHRGGPVDLRPAYELGILGDDDEVDEE